MEGDMERAATIPPADRLPSADGTPDRRRLIASFVFAAVTLGACVLLAKRFTHTSWPLQRANLGLVGGAVALYFASYVFRALGWQKLFPAASRPDRARCLAACGASAASGAVLPFRLDYLVKIGTLRKMRGVKLGLEGDRTVHHLARPRGRDRLPPALDLRHGHDLLELPNPAAPCRSLRHRRLWPPRRRSTSAGAAFRCPPGAPVQPRRTRRGTPAAHARSGHRLVLPPRLLDVTCTREHGSSRWAWGWVLAHSGSRRPLSRRRGVADPDRLRRRGRERQRDRCSTARTRSAQGAGNQLRSGLRPAALQHCHGSGNRWGCNLARLRAARAGARSRCRVVHGSGQLGAGLQSRHVTTRSEEHTSELQS